MSPCQGESEHASDGPDQESYRPETQALHEDLSRIRGKKRCKRSEVQKVQKQKPALEEKRACEIVFSVNRVFCLPSQRNLIKVSRLKTVFAQPFFISGTA